MNPVKALENHGQAVWLDFLARGFVAKGDLKQLIETDGVKGVTSNPSIFEKAIGSSDEYDGAIANALKKGDRPVADLFEAVAIEDIQNAADVLRPVYDAIEAASDGFVSLEVSPYLAMDTKGTDRRGRAALEGRQAQEFDGQGAGDAGRPARDRASDRRRHQHQHHAVVLAEGLSSRSPRPISRGWKNTSPRAAIPLMSPASPASSSAASTAPSTSSSTRRSREPTIPPRRSA